MAVTLLYIVTFFVLLPNLTIQTSQVKTSFAAGKSRKNFILDVQPTRTIAHVSLIQCLQLCKKHGCQAFNYGFKECALLPTYYCGVSVTFRKPMKQKKGYTYYDVATDKINEVSIQRLDSTACKDKQACSKKCACVTTDGIPCYFPVDFDGKTFHACTKQGWQEAKKVTWCSTNSNRAYDGKKWGYCGPACPVEQN